MAAGVPSDSMTSRGSKDNAVITVSGGVKMPGEYPLRQGMTMMSAITRAGGFADSFSQLHKITLLRNGKPLVFNLKTLAPDGSNNPLLRDGDEVIVPTS